MNFTSHIVATSHEADSKKTATEDVISKVNSQHEQMVNKTKEHIASLLSYLLKISL